jgi:hypothetical protein
MHIVQLIEGVELGAVEVALADDVGGDIVEHQVAEDIRNEVHIGK